MFYSSSASYYLVNTLLGLSIGLVAKIVTSPTKPNQPNIFADVWIWLVLGVIGSFIGSFTAFLFGWIQPQVMFVFILQLISLLFWLVCFPFFPYPMPSIADLLQTPIMSVSSVLSGLVGAICLIFLFQKVYLKR
jgi:uncharacterized membrane protein YeaQ/YmgE (transglycosylase-associated protein family)